MHVFLYCTWKRKRKKEQDKSKSTAAAVTQFLSFHMLSFRLCPRSQDNYINQPMHINIQSKSILYGTSTTASVLPSSFITLTRTYRFICQGTRSGNNSYTAWFVNVPRHDPNFTFSRLDNSRTVWPNQPSFCLPVQSSLHLYLKFTNISFMLAFIIIAKVNSNM